MKTVLIVIDMQRGSFSPYQERYDTDGLISRINMLAEKVRLPGGKVIFIQHNGPQEDPHHPMQRVGSFYQTLMYPMKILLLQKQLATAF